MKSISLDLPLKYRLDLTIIKRRGASGEEENLLPSLESIKNSRSGNKVSRYFRHVFEHKHIRRILGSHVALFIIATSFVPVSASNISETPEQVLVSANDVKIKTEGHIQYPLEKVKINQRYFFFHPGIDFEGKTGEPVRPVMAGEVEAIQYSGFAYGNAILLRHGDNFSSLYAHLSRVQVEVGQKVDMNTTLGDVGSTGRSSGDHLHLEIRENGRPINPLSMLPKL